MKTSNKKQGFTIIETLVAITVLMIAIAGPLSIASKGLFGANASRDQMIASYLAQESMEIVKNIRDNNIYQGVNWLNSVSGCTSGAKCDASAIDGIGSNPSIVNCPAGSLCPLYVQTNGYGHTAGRSTIYSRGFYIHGAGVTGSCASTDECGVTVEVAWYEGTTPYSTILTSVITNNIR